MKILSLNEIKSLLNTIDLTPLIAKSFIAYAENRAVIPPVGELSFENPPGDVHIKYGYVKDDDCYVIKIASGFYENPKLQLPSSNGLMLVFSKKTGALLGILLDEGYLTDVRTAVAGAIVAQYLAPKFVSNIGIIGTGIQAKLQLHFLKPYISCRSVFVWGRDLDKCRAFKTAMEKEGFSISATKNIDDIASNCNLIVTTTPSTSPLLFADQIKPGTHITAVGADSPHKQELEAAIFKLADLVVADSIVQCVERGDLAHAIKSNLIRSEEIYELGNVIAGRSPRRTSDEQITIADLTGVAVQDIAIAKAVFEASD